MKSGRRGAKFSFSTKQTMKRTTIVLVSFIVIGRSSAANAQYLQLQVRETGYMTDEWITWLVNPGPIPVSFDGYTISDGADRLNAAAWRSVESVVIAGGPGGINDVISTFGAGALAFGSANPGPGNLTELTLGAGGTMQPGAQWNFGPIIDPGPPPDYPRVDADLAFGYSGGSPPAGFETIVVVPGVPEPSTLMLGMLGTILGLAFTMRHRNGRA